jgi:hypothetical protein
MKWPLRQARVQEISNTLASHSQNVRPLAGIADPRARGALAMQIMASLRRDEYFQIIQNRGLMTADRADPNSARFEAELGVVYFLQNGMYDEAAWLIFLMVALAKPGDSGWARLKDIYGKLGQGRWSWQEVAAAPSAVEDWLAQYWNAIGGKFGNHRKYASLRPDSALPFGRAVTEYVTWVIANGGHQALFGRLILEGGNDPHSIFDRFYDSLPIKGFGRLGRFDWVAMLARYGFTPAEAGSAYLKEATGPKAGIKLLFENDAESSTSPAVLQAWLDDLDGDLKVGMEVLEDSICNWQKTPLKFTHFNG